MSQYRVEYILDGTESYFKINCEDNDNLIDHIVNYMKTRHNLIFRPYILSLVTSIKIIKCLGCLFDSPGQKHHMGPGGCL